MKSVRDYREDAKAHQIIFRNILRDLRENRTNRPMGDYIPEDLASELTTNDFFEIYSKGERDGKFTVFNFSREGERASISFENKSFMCGGGAELGYKVGQDDSVEFVQHHSLWRF